jgi:hypothetical protein
MGKLRDYIKKIQAITEDQQDKGILSVVKDHENIIVDLNTSQLMDGKRSDGSEMPHYSPASVEIFGKPTGPIRLFDQGDFHKGFFLEADKFPVMFNSTDEKTVMLVEGRPPFKPGYGEAIFGLTKTNLAGVTEDYLKEGTQRYYRVLLLP